MIKTFEKWILLVIVLAVIATSAGLLMRKNQPTTKKNNPAVQQPAFDPKHPNFIMGYFVSAAKDKIVLKYNNSNVAVAISPTTKLVNKVSDYKTGQLIMVYFSNQPVGSVYQADKVQLIGK